MDKFSFKPNSPGMHILWMLQFKPGDSKSKQVDLYIPSPFNNEWHNASGLEKTLENLGRIQKVCNEIKEKTRDPPPQETSFIKYIKKLKDLLKSFSSYDDFLKKEDNPPEKKQNETDPP